MNAGDACSCEGFWVSDHVLPLDAHNNPQSFYMEVVEFSGVTAVGETGYGCHTFYSTDVFRNIVLIADIRLLLCLNIVSCAHINMQFFIFTS